MSTPAFDPDRVLALAIDPATVTVVRDQVAFLARTIGEGPGIHTDLELARAAGHPDLVAPPSYLFTVLNAVPRPFGDLASAGVDPGDVLHGEQSFTYAAPVHAGDTLVVAPRYVEAFTKKDGALRFLVRETTFERDGEVVGTERATLVAPVRTGA